MYFTPRAPRLFLKTTLRASPPQELLCSSTSTLQIRIFYRQRPECALLRICSWPGSAGTEADGSEWAQAMRPIGCACLNWIRHPDWSPRYRSYYKAERDRM